MLSAPIAKSALENRVDGCGIKAGFSRLAIAARNPIVIRLDLRRAKLGTIVRDRGKKAARAVDGTFFGAAFPVTMGKAARLGVRSVPTGLARSARTTQRTVS